MHVEFQGYKCRYFQDPYSCDVLLDGGALLVAVTVLHYLNIVGRTDNSIVV